MIIEKPITIKGANKVLKRSQGFGNVYFKNEHDYNDFLLYIKNTYSHRALNTKQFLYSFTSNIGTEFRLRRNDGGIFMLQSHNKKWNW